MLPRHLRCFEDEVFVEDLKGVGATCYIYTLHASNDPELRPRYVGFTRRLKRREIEHNTGGEQGRKGDWVRGLLAVGSRAVLTAIYTFQSDNARERAVVEAHWIAKYQSEYADILNDFGGGDGVAPCSNELRAKRSRQSLGRVLTAEHKAKVALSKIGKKREPRIIEAMRQANLGRRFSAERRAQMSAARMGKKASPETRAKISAANKGRKPSPESTAKRVLKLRGRKHTPEHRAKISAAGMGRKASPETLAKRSALLRGKKRSPEQKERMKQAAIKRFADPAEREKCSKAQKLRFTNPLERAKNSKAQKLRFTNPEEMEKNRLMLTRESRKYWDSRKTTV